MEEETISHLFYYCIHIQDILNQVQIYFTDCFHFSQLPLQTAIFGFHNIENQNLIQNHIFLLFKLYIYIYIYIYIYMHVHAYYVRICVCIRGVYIWMYIFRHYVYKLACILFWSYHPVHIEKEKKSSEKKLK